MGMFEKKLDGKYLWELKKPVPIAELDLVMRLTVENGRLKDQIELMEYEKNMLSVALHGNEKNLIKCDKELFYAQIALEEKTKILNKFKLKRKKNEQHEQPE